MSTTPLFSPENRKSAYIRDDALILYFETAETPLVARFDLDSLVQANFEVSKKDEQFALILRDFSGQRQEITVFANKADAHQALYAILQALLSYGEAQKEVGEKPNLFWKFLKWLILTFIVALGIGFALIWLATPVSHIAIPEATKTAQPATHSAEPAATTLPEGEPMDMEQFITTPDQQSSSAPSGASMPGDVQTGVMTPEQMQQVPMLLPGQVTDMPSAGSNAEPAATK